MTTYNLILLFLLIVVLLDSVYLKENVQWIECEDRAEQSRYMPLCTTVTVPLVWHSSTNRSLDLFVRKLPATSSTTVKGQVWLLSDSIRDTGDFFIDMEIASKLKSGLNDQYDIYIPHQRGTGRSPILTCSNYNSNTASIESIQRCYSEQIDNFESGELAGFGTTQAANDIAHLITIASEPKTTVIVYAVGSGTFLLNRLLMLHPDLVDMVIADSIHKPSYDALNIDNYVVELGNRLIASCQKSTYCHSKFGGKLSSIEGRVKRTLLAQQSDYGCIPDRFSASDITYLSAMLMMGKGFDASYKYILPMFYRLHRCNANDRLWLLRLRSVITNDAFHRSVEYSDSSSVDMLISNEMVHKPMKRDRSYWMNKFGTYPPFFNSRQSLKVVSACDALSFANYSDPLNGQYARGYRKPMLTMHGTMNANYPHSDTKEWLANFDQSRFASFPLFSHGILSRSDCAMELIASFINNPTAPLLDACVKKLPERVNFAQSPSSDFWLFEDFEESEFDPDPKPRRDKILVLSVVSLVMVLAISSVGIITCTARLMRRRKRLSYEQIADDIVY